jgi:IclR family KDG regulon transcriptional repressor
MGDRILRKGLKILEHLASSRDGASAMELCELIGVHKTSIYRYLATLKECGYVRKESSGQYVLDTKILQLGSEILQRMPLRETAHPFLVELSEATSKTTHLSVLDELEVIYLDKVEGPKTLPIISRIGSRAPAHCTGVGKALLSTLPTSVVETLLQSATLESYTDATIVDPKALLEELAKTRDRGYAIDEGEHELYVRCFAAPISGYGGRAVAAISITGLIDDFEDPSTRVELLDHLKQAAAGISNALGSGSPSA